MKCNNCGGEYEYKEGLKFCPLCGGKIEEEEYYCAWEDRSRIGFFEGLFESWKDTIVDGKNFFKKLQPTGYIGSALLYALIILIIGSLSQLLWNIGWNAMFGSLPFRNIAAQEAFAKYFTAGFAIIWIIMLPVILVVYLFIHAGITHLLLLIIGGANKGIEATLKTICYAQSPMIFQIVPFCGGLVASVWAIVLEIIGLREVHKTTTGKAAFAILFPIIFCCFAALLIFGFIFSMAGREIFRELFR